MVPYGVESDMMQHGVTFLGEPVMTPIQIDGLDFFFMADIADEVGVSRQTLWRWRNDGKIPSGHRYRDGRVLFTAGEFAEIQGFANRLEPIGQTYSDQLRLFG